MFTVPKFAIGKAVRSLAADTRGNVAMLFAFSIVPMMLVAGTAVDFGRALTEKERLQHALDATGLAIAQQPRGTPLSTLQDKANAYFAASFRSSAGIATPTITVTQASPNLRLEANTSIDTAIMSLAGVDTIALRAVSLVRNERQKIEIALVLDNTGSMAQAGKMPALKAAVDDLITKLQAKVVAPDDIKLSIVPFNTEVKVDTAYAPSAWLRWDVTLENANFGWGAQPPAPATWQGCISDRDQPHDTTAVPVTDHFRKYVAAQCHFAGLTTMLPLTTDLEAIRTRANAMTPTGNTNVTIGLTMGLATLRPDSPLGAASSSAPNVQKFLILLTDGDNTMNRWTNDSTQIDQRLETGCNQARSSGVQIFTIRVIAGNASLLRACATNPSMYYDVNHARELQPVFNKIIETIDGIRIVS